MVRPTKRALATVTVLVRMVPTKRARVTTTVLVRVLELGKRMELWWGAVRTAPWRGRRLERQLARW
jgi:hypothetical protein